MGKCCLKRFLLASARVNKLKAEVFKARVCHLLVAGFGGSQAPNASSFSVRYAEHQYRGVAYLYTAEQQCPYHIYLDNTAFSNPLTEGSSLKMDESGSLDQQHH